MAGKLLKIESHEPQAATLPNYIGYPGIQISGDLKDDSGQFIKEELDKKLLFARIKPLLTKESEDDANLYEADIANGIKNFESDLAGLRISWPHAKEGWLYCVLSNISPISESFTNSFTDSELVGGLKSLFERRGIQEAAQLLGIDSIAGDGNRSALNKIGDLFNTFGLNLFPGAVDKMTDFGQGIVGWLDEQSKDPNSGRIAKTGSKLAKTAINALNHLGHKMSFPQMWADCAFQQSYELCIRLYAYNCSTIKEYFDNVVAPTVALSLFCCPRSPDGVLYNMPYMMELEIPGLVYMPMAYCSNMSVIKGGDTNDITLSGRPGIIDLRMTINSVYSVMVNAGPNDNKSYNRPTTYTYAQMLSGGKCLGERTSPALDLTNSTGSLQESISGKYNDEKAKADANKSATTQDTNSRKEPTTEQKNAAAALQNNQQNNTPATQNSNTNQGNTTTNPNQNNQSQNQNNSNQNQRNVLVIL